MSVLDSFERQILDTLGFQVGITDLAISIASSIEEWASWTENDLVAFPSTIAADHC